MDKMDKTEQIALQTAQLQAAAIYSGPIPQASEMARYAEINKDFPNRIMTMAEEQAKHRQSIENKTLKDENTQKMMGAIFGFVIALSCIACGTYCIINGKDATGLGIIIADLAALVGTFIYSARKK